MENPYMEIYALLMGLGGTLSIGGVACMVAILLRLCRGQPGLHDADLPGRRGHSMVAQLSVAMLMIGAAPALYLLPQPHYSQPGHLAQVGTDTTIGSKLIL